jgi:pimeloyl-ACP methyl ester carboxylesterase
MLPVASLILMKLTGSMKMRKSDDQILGALYKYPIEKKIDTLSINNRDITYLLTSGDTVKKKDAIIFVHGSPGSLDAYLGYMHSDTLLARADLIAYDRPGFGHSNFGRSMSSLRGQAVILYGIMKSLNYDRYWLVGHSYGAAIIVQAAIDKPHDIEGMGLIAGSIIYELEPVASWRKWLDLPFVRRILPFALRVSNEELISLRRDLRMIDDDWDQISIPVSLIHGRKDILVPFNNLELATDKLSRADTVRTLIFEEENHFILWTKKNEIIQEIIELMDVSEKYGDKMSYQ